MRAMSYEENTKPEPDDADELEISHVLRHAEHFDEGLDASCPQVKVQFE